MLCIDSISTGRDEFSACLDSDHKIQWIKPERDEYSDAVGRHCYESLAGLDHPCEDCPVAVTFKSGQFAEAEISLSDERSFEVKGYPTSAANGSPVGVMLLVKPVLESQRDDVSAPDGPLLYKIPIEQSSFPHIIFDLNTLKPIRYNVAAMKLLGYSYEEFNEIDYNTLDEKSTPGELDALIGLVRKDGHHCYDTVITNSSGQKFDCRVTLDRLELGSTPIMLAVFQDISDKKEAEMLLSESESLYRSLVENSPDTILQLDRKGRILFCNRILTGLNKEDAIGTNLLDYIPGEHHKKVRQALDRSGSRRRNTSYDVSVTTPAGTRWWSTRVLPLERNGRLDRFLLIITDNTEAKRAEEALRLSEERYRNLVEHSPLPIFVYSGETIRFLSPMGVEILGAASSEKLMGRSILEFIHPDDRKVARQKLIQHSRSNDQTTQADFRIKRLDGGVLNVVSSTIDVKFEGEPCKMAIINDVSDRVTAEEALRASERKFRYLTEKMRDAVWMMDFNWNHSYISPSIEKIRGFTPGEILTLPIEDSLPPHSIENAKRKLADALSRGGYNEDGSPYTTTFEQEEYRKDGSLVWTEVQATLVYDDEGKPVGMMGITRDISERKLAEDTLRQSEEQYRSLIDSFPLPIIIHRDGVIIYCNSKAIAVIDATGRDQLIDRKIVDFVHEDDRQLFQKMRDLTHDDHHVVNRGKMKFVSLDGKTIQADIKSIYALFDGAPARMIIFYNYENGDVS